MKIIIGLGNPGNAYKGTRHNVGFETIDKLCFDSNIKLKPNRRFKAHVGEGHIHKTPILLVKPQTYMNLSGQSVQSIIKFYKLPPQDIIVIYDDVSLPVGDIRIRESGSAGGQKGMIDIIAKLATDEFPRVRIGVGQKPEGWDLADYVLSRFPKKEWEAMIQGITKAGDAVELILKEGTKSAMNEFNRRIQV
ncbi:MAG: aminoacyl-tRNA hydrolase [Defluviitaleaceae bacterium]|nr:aminoacyl-tRNA hydrolase [Defluviitaleaceae bacterium]